MTGTIEAYELIDDQYDGGISTLVINVTGSGNNCSFRASQHSEINKLDAEITALVSKRDYAGAAKLQTELDEVLARINARRDLENGIKDAVARRDFMKAAELQARVNEMNEGLIGVIL